MSRLLHAAIVTGLAAAIGCGGGDDDEALPDGAVAPDGGGDGAPVNCTAEADDTRNGDTPQATGLTYAGAAVAICGTVDLGHASGELIDRDLYQLTVSPEAPLVVRLTAPLGGAVDRLDLIVRDAAGPRALARVRAGNAVTALQLPEGAYTLGVEARAASAAVPIPYRIEVHADDPALRCPVAPGGAVHAELDEAVAGHRANDVIEARDAPPLLRTQLTAATLDAPDPTDEAVTAGDRFTITGLSAAVASAGDAYLDRDTFSFYTGATTNQLDIRVTWLETTVDLDVLVLDGDGPTDPMGTPQLGTTGELIVTAVEPSTPYLLWVGGSTRSTALPATYAIQVCGREITAAPVSQ